MSGPEERIEDVAGPMLRMYRGDESESDGPEAADDFEETQAASARRPRRRRSGQGGSLPTDIRPGWPLKSTEKRGSRT